MARMSEEKRTAARLAASEKRRALLEQEKKLDLFKRAEMLQAAGEIRTTDGVRLSEKNTLLVYMQATAAGFAPSMVGGFKQWREQGRTVRMGEKGLLICFPKMGKDEESGSDELRGFGWGYVFDISQTAAKGEEEEEEEKSEKKEKRRKEEPKEEKKEEQKAAASGGGDLADILAAIAAA